MDFLIKLFPFPTILVIVLLSHIYPIELPKKEEKIKTMSREKYDRQLKEFFDNYDSDHCDEYDSD